MTKVWPRKADGLSYAAACLLSLLMPCGYARAADAAASDRAPARTPTPPLHVSSEFEDRREGESRMTWKLQKMTFSDGSSVLTLAGLQFEEAQGLSILIVEPPPLEAFFSESFKPQNTETSSAPFGPGQGRNIVDLPTRGEKRLPGDKARADIQIKNTLIDLKELRNPQSGAIAALPACDNGRRKAVIFIRPDQTARQMEISIQRATELSQYGRAACVRWDDFPPPSKS